MKNSTRDIILVITVALLLGGMTFMSIRDAQKSGYVKGCVEAVNGLVRQLNQENNLGISIPSQEVLLEVCKRAAKENVK